MRQLSAALPEARQYGVDLSGYYIKEAARTLADVPDVSLVVDNAEHLPFDGGTFDAVVSIFLFHELPRAVRRRVAAEMVRVLRPGGTVVVLDSAQFVESESVRFFLERFAKIFHEPYYRDYLKDDLERLFAAAGGSGGRGRSPRGFEGGGGIQSLETPSGFVPRKLSLRSTPPRRRLTW